jgi:hypothetical protein
VLAVLFTGLTLTQMKEPTESHQIAAVQALESSRIDGAADFVGSSSLLPSPADVVSTVPEQRIAKARRARYTRRPEHRRPTQTFTPPSMLTLSPQRVVMLAYDPPIPSTAELTPPQLEEPSLTISPPPQDRVGGVRRLLQAIVYPFKKVGQGLAN